MITIDERYYITADQNGYALMENVTRTASRNGKEHKKGDVYEEGYAIGYSSRLNGMINVYVSRKINDLVRSDVNYSLMEIKNKIDEITKFVEKQIIV